MAVFLVWLGALVGSTVGGALVGGVAGAVTAVPADTVREAEAALTRSLRELNPQEELRARVFRVAQRGDRHLAVELPERGPSSPDERLTYSWAATERVDSVLEISLLTVELAGEWDVDPPVTLTLSSRTRLVRVQDGKEIHEAALGYMSGARRFTEWAANEAELFREELDRALASLAEVIGERYFMVHPVALDSPGGVAVNAMGTLFIADTGSHRIRRVEPDTGVITTVAGTGEPGVAGDGGPAAGAQLASPSGIALDARGTLFIADRDNHRVRKVEPDTGIITTVAGTGDSGFAGGGGPATGAQLASPVGIALDARGALFIADRDNHRVRKVEPDTGIITTVAGTGEPGFAGDGGPATGAQISNPAAVEINSAGNLFIADTRNHRIRRVETATGVITTVAGTGQPGVAGDGGLATNAQLAIPAGITLDRTGTLFIADQGNHRIRKVVASTGIITAVAHGVERPTEKLDEHGARAPSNPGSNRSDDSP